MAFTGVEDDTWSCDEQAGQFCRHQFCSHQPDLNIANLAVREKVFRVWRSCCG
ncbi:alpha-amylase family glycosyl hydrolase [Crossiella equi]|uniref:alpha-amylase family glycosyl hydrolase n=1 Tax=Crossiella equi TaxID=130796 RepID=UPI0011776D89